MKLKKIAVMELVFVLLIGSVLIGCGKRASASDEAEASQETFEILENLNTPALEASSEVSDEEDTTDNEVNTDEEDMFDNFEQSDKKDTENDEDGVVGSNVSSMENGNKNPDKSESTDGNGNANTDVETDSEEENEKGVTLPDDVWE